MTYLSNRRRRRVVRSRPPMGGVLDFLNDILNPLDSSVRKVNCVGELIVQLDPIDAKIAEIDRAWNPTGFFTADDITRVFDVVLSEVGSSLDRIVSANIDGLAKAVSGEIAALQSVASESSAFVDAVRKARASGIRVINAPGLKPWAMRTLKAARELTSATVLFACDQPEIRQQTLLFFQGLDKIGAVVRAIGNAALKAGEVAIDVVGGLGQFLGVVVKFLPHIALGAGALYLYTKFKKSP